MKRGVLLSMTIVAGLAWAATYFLTLLPGERIYTASTGVKIPQRPRILTGSETSSWPARFRPTSMTTLSMASIMEKHENVADAIADATAVFGPTDQKLVSTVAEAVVACSALPEEADFRDPRSGLMEGMRDSSKIWAIAKLQDLCEGFNSAKVLADQSAAKNSPAHVSEPDQGLQLAAARQALRASQDRKELAQAGHLLLQKNELPIHEIFGADPKLGQAELGGAWIQATSLATCVGQLGCGPNSLLTVSYCARVGCQQGVSYDQALASSLAPRDYRAVVAFSNWIRNRSQ